MATTASTNEPIQRLLVIGTDRLAGELLARRWAERYDVMTHDRCDAADCHAVIAGADADAVIYCGPASEPSWSPTAATQLTSWEVDNAAAWAKAAGPRFVMISSDAVFTGPYMFHDESCDGFCSSTEANIIRAAEQAVLDACETALIVRTHVFGVSSRREGLVEQILSDGVITVGGGGYATPIYGADLADILERALADGTDGVLHIAGAERVSPHQFAERLLEAFDRPRHDVTVLIGEHASGFASGDHALICRETRDILGLSMPLLTESFAALRTSLKLSDATIRAAA